MSEAVSCQYSVFSCQFSVVGVAFFKRVEIRRRKLRAVSRPLKADG